MLMLRKICVDTGIRGDVKLCQEFLSWSIDPKIPRVVFCQDLACLAPISTYSEACCPYVHLWETCMPDPGWPEWVLKNCGQPAWKCLWTTHFIVWIQLRFDFKLNKVSSTDYPINCALNSQGFWSVPLFWLSVLSDSDKVMRGQFFWKIDKFTTI